MTTRHLYVVRHAEASDDESALSARGVRQAELLAERLRPVPFTAVHHGPLPRAAQTARLIHDRLGGVPLHACEPAGDYLPYIPPRAELPPETADATLARLAQFPVAERELGPGLADQALARFTGPAEGEADAAPRHELVVTHNFLAAWLVRDALQAPRARWIGLDLGNAALTVIRYAPGRPASLLVLNDMSHLPQELRWTGFPAELHV
ncbi:histidine phosphatase family protein [Streptomyces sp. NPDC050095]